MYCGEAGITVRVWASAGAHPMARAATRRRKGRAGVLKVRHRIATRCSGSKSRACVQLPHQALPRGRRRASRRTAQGGQNRVIRVPTGLLARLTIGLVFAMAFVTNPAWATLATDCTGACHDASNQAHFNGAGASNIITYANTTMGATFTGGSTAASIAAEIQALMTSNYPNNEAITFQTAKTFNLPRLFHSQVQGAAAGATDSVSTVSAPGSGTVSYPAVADGVNYQATYTPFACTTGNDSFSYRASGPGGNTSTRTATVVIGNP